MLSPMYEYIIIVLSYVVHDIIATKIHPSMATATAVKCTIMYTVIARQITENGQFLILFMTVHTAIHMLKLIWHFTPLHTTG